MKKRITSLLMVLALCLTLLPTAALAADAHQHPICGATCTDEKNHTAYTTYDYGLENGSTGSELYVFGKPNGSATYGDKLDQTNDKNADWILSAGSYYLRDDIAIKNSIVIEGKVTLCLNGNDIQSISDYTRPMFYVKDGGSLTLTDCSSGERGKVYHYSTGYEGTPYGVFVYKGGAFNMYGGEISGNRMAGVVLQYNQGYDRQATFNMYGGVIGENSGYGVDIGTGSVFNMYGGTIQNLKWWYGADVNVSGVYCKGDFNMYGGTIQNCYRGVHVTCHWNGDNKAISYGEFKMTGGTIKNNETGVDVFAYFDVKNGVRTDTILKRSEMTMTGGTITGNTEVGVDLGA